MARQLVYGMVALALLGATPARADVVVVNPDFSALGQSLAGRNGPSRSPSAPVSRTATGEVTRLPGNLVQFKITAATQGLGPTAPNVLSLVHIAIARNSGLALPSETVLRSIGYSFNRTDTRLIDGLIRIPELVASYAVLVQDGRLYIHETRSNYGTAAQGLGGISVTAAGLRARDFLFYNPNSFGTIPTVNPDLTRPFGFGVGYFRSLSAGPDGEIQRLSSDVRFGNISFSLTTGGVPEPATWAMMILGFGVIGGALRAARRSARLQNSAA